MHYISIKIQFVTLFCQRLKRAAVKKWQQKMSDDGEKTRIKFNWKSLSHFSSSVLFVWFLGSHFFQFWFFFFLLWLTYDLEQFLINPICSLSWRRNFCPKIASLFWLCLSLSHRVFLLPVFRRCHFEFKFMCQNPVSGGKLKLSHRWLAKTHNFHLNFGSVSVSLQVRRQKISMRVCQKLWNFEKI